MELPMAVKPGGIMVNGKKVGSTSVTAVTASLNSDFKTLRWNYDRKSKLLLIRVPDDGGSRNITIK
jgi:hypothetical protein